MRKYFKFTIENLHALSFPMFITGSLIYELIDRKDPIRLTCLISLIVIFFCLHYLFFILQKNRKKVREFLVNLMKRIFSEKFINFLKKHF